MEHNSLQSEIEDYLDELNVVYQHDHDPRGQSLIILPEKHIVLKINVPEENAGRENPALMQHFADSDFRLVQVWGDQWMRNKEIVKSRLRALAGKSATIYGRDTSVSKITNPVLIAFLQENHLHVPLKGKYKYGLFKSGKLVSVASFSYPRNVERGGKRMRSYELLRFCHINNHIVTGGLTKLLKQFTNDIKPGHLMTYVDREWGVGSGFRKAGFSETGYLPPAFLWVNPQTFERFYPSRGEKNLATNPPSDRKLVKIYNCGSIKMEKIFF